MPSIKQTYTSALSNPDQSRVPSPAVQHWAGHQLRSRRPVLVAMICVALAGRLQGVDPALHSVAMPQAALELGMDPAMAAFIKSIGTIVLAASMLGVGIVGDRYGRGKALVAGTLLMAVAAVVTATATTPLLFGLGRALMGLATATSFAMCLAFIPTLYPREQLPKAFGVFFGVGASLIVAATALSGTIQGLFGWRATYLATAALCLLIGLAALRFLPENRAGVLRRFDAPGVLLAAVGLIALVYSIGRAATLGWGHPLVLSGLAAAAVVLTAFAIWELRCKHPAFPVELFRIPAFTAACLAGVLFNWADASLLGQYPALALPAGVPAAAVSVIVALMYFGMICGAPAAGLAQNRFGLSNRTMFTSGLLLCAAGLAIQVLLKNPHDLLLPAVGLFIVGFAVMWMQNPQSSIIMGSAPADQLGAVGAVKPAVGQFGFGLGFALAGPIASIFTEGPALTPQAYGLGLLIQAVLFVLAAGLVFVLLKPRPAPAAT